MQRGVSSGATQLMVTEDRANEDLKVKLFGGVQMLESMYIIFLVDITNAVFINLQCKK